MSISEADLERFGRAIWRDLRDKRATAVNQAKFGLNRILPTLKRLGGVDCHVLEVGAGRMLLSAYLASKGIRVTALEPLTSDFRWFDALQRDVLAYCAREGIAFERIDGLAEEYVAPARYDLIFSIHVLEHMRDPERALQNMYQSLKTPGVLLALCPNYDVPFEPHLGIWLLGRGKSLNGRLYRRRIAAKQELWDRLFFVRYSTLRRFLAGQRIQHSFNRNTLYDMFLQLGKDRLFYERMPRFIRAMYKVLVASRLTNLLRWIPLRMQTPMELLVIK